MYDDAMIATKTRLADRVVGSVRGDIFLVFSHDLIPWVVMNEVMRKATWVPSFDLPVKRFAMEVILHSKQGATMPSPLPITVTRPKFDEPRMVINEAKIGFYKTYLTWANALLTDPDEIYGIGIVFSLWSPIIGIGDIRLRDTQSDRVEYDFYIKYQFNESVPLIDALAEFIVKKDDEEGDLI